MPDTNITIAVIGLGYVGLSVAVAFGRQYPTIGDNIKKTNIAAYQTHRDPTGELTSEELKAARFLEYTIDHERLHAADAIIIAVLTPIDDARQPEEHAYDH